MNLFQLMFVLKKIIFFLLIQLVILISLFIFYFFQYLFFHFFFQILKYNNLLFHCQNLLHPNVYHQMLLLLHKHLLIYLIKKHQMSLHPNQKQLYFILFLKFYPIHKPLLLQLVRLLCEELTILLFVLHLLLIVFGNH